MRASMRASMRLSVAGDDDEYNIHALAIPDGFRPSTAPASPTSHQQFPMITSIPPPDSDATPETIQRSLTTSRPSSIAKPPRPTDSFALGNDGATGPSVGSPLSRVSSVSTEPPMIQAESPYQGPSGPSHPYQMYLQRTFSTATTTTMSTATPMSERSYHGPRGPAHPYGLYPQGTTPTSGTQGGSISVGFPGTQDGYQRRVGPEGEEVGDLIGPLGHTEELPPYSRYPDEAYTRKVRDMTQPGPAPGPASDSAPEPVPGPVGATVIASEVPSTAIPGAGGIGLATRNPEFASTDDLDSPRSRLSTRSFTSDASQHEINTAARTITEKPPLKKWQMRAKKRMWGIVPYWAICLLAIGLVLMGIILGAVIGTFLAKQHKRPPPRDDDA
jgi:hypothetical protein